MKLVDTLSLDTGPLNTAPGQISQRSVLTVLLALLPVVVLLSGMAMTPYLVLLALLMIAAQGGRIDLRALFQDGRTTFLVMALIIGLPILSIVWSITPGISAEWALKTAAIMVIGAIALLLSRRLPGLAPSSALAFAASILLCAVLVMLEQLPHGGLLALGYDLTHPTSTNTSTRTSTAACAPWRCSCGRRAWPWNAAAAKSWRK